MSEERERYGEAPNCEREVPEEMRDERLFPGKQLSFFSTEELEDEILSRIEGN